ncbi:hypothetical protein CNYM01_12524 [Colletotrichum nymphaeae SA-01]|uniref:Uncharacterized protein n=1 Tax=Colletotrichum nymphaeae SA-01 TaxID=1460502 RepID=A0A135SUV9_9PEZI|nr:hypothetical protein CNYM01_12524 [Colletotrichum nymphaeae SA-01]
MLLSLPLFPISFHLFHFIPSSLIISYLPEGEASTSESNAAFVVVFVKGAAYSRFLLAIADTTGQATNTSCAAIHRISDCPPALNTECSRSEHKAASEQHRFKKKKKKKKKRGILAHLSIHSPPSPSPSLLQHSLFGPSTTARSVSRHSHLSTHPTCKKDSDPAHTHEYPYDISNQQPAAISPLRFWRFPPLSLGRLAPYVKEQRNAKLAKLPPSLPSGVLFAAKPNFESTRVEFPSSV